MQRYLNEKGVPFFKLYQKHKEANRPQVSNPEKDQAVTDYYARLWDFGELRLITRAEMPHYMLKRHTQLSKKPFVKHINHSYLADYFAGDPKFSEAQIIAKHDRMKPALTKGIALVGDYGVGKSTALKCCSQLDKNTGVYLNNGYTHYLDTNEFALNYSISGMEIYDRWKNKPILFIDDVGNEPDVKYYGSEIRVVAQLLRYRYEHNLITHITSNSKLSELTTIYGQHVTDRMLDQFNFFMWEGESKRGT